MGQFQKQPEKNWFWEYEQAKLFAKAPSNERIKKESGQHEKQLMSCFLEFKQRKIWYVCICISYVQLSWEWKLRS